jgi:hypothetical protein
MTEDERRLLLITARILRNVVHDQIRDGDAWTQKADYYELEAAIDAVDPPRKPPAPEDDGLPF